VSWGRQLHAVVASPRPWPTRRGPDAQKQRIGTRSLDAQPCAAGSSWRERVAALPPELQKLTCPAAWRAEIGPVRPCRYLGDGSGLRVESGGLGPQSRCAVFGRSIPNGDPKFPARVGCSHSFAEGGHHVHGPRDQTDARCRRAARRIQACPETDHASTATGCADGALRVRCDAAVQDLREWRCGSPVTLTSLHRNRIAPVAIELAKDGSPYGSRK